MFTTTSSLYGASFAPPPAPKPLPKDAYFEFMVARRNEASPQKAIPEADCSSHLALVANTFLARFLAFLLSLVLALVCRRCRERSFEGVR